MAAAGKGLPAVPARTAYHHGDLRNALIDEALRRVAEHGYRSVVGREVALAVGVAPSATYRHFASHGHLLATVSRRAREALARHMLDAADRAAPEMVVAHDDARDALARFDAIGRAYVDFARFSPGLFEVAFANVGAPPDAPDNPSAWGVLSSSIGDIAAAGAMDGRRLNVAPFVAWSAVHGLAGILGTPVCLSAAGAAEGAVVDGILDAVKRSLGMTMG